VSNDDINRAILLTWRSRDDGGVTLSADDRQTLERLVGEMARAIRTEPERTDAATADLRAEVERLTGEVDERRWGENAYRQDVTQLSRIVGRTTHEMVFENTKGSQQKTKVYVFADGCAYAPIFGSDAKLFKSVEALARDMEPQLGNGFKFVRVQKRGAVEADNG